MKKIVSVNKEKIRKVLVINLGGIGDLLLSTSALRALRKLYPGVHISLLAVPRAIEIVENLPYLDEFIPFDFPTRGGIKLRNFLVYWCFLLFLRRKKFDLAINMRTIHTWQSALKMAIIFFFINARYRAGRNTEGKGFFFNIRIPETEVGIKYERDYDLDTIKALGGNSTDRKIELKINEKNSEYIVDFLKYQGVEDNDLLIGIHPGGLPSRRWPIENFVSVIKELAEIKKCKIVITGGPEEITLSQKIQDFCGNKIIVATGKINVKGLAALIKRCHLFISNDTGSMHIAAVLGVPTVAIFGPGDLTRYDPRNLSDKCIVLYKPKECAPCIRVECNNLKCLKQISPEEVLNAALKLLS